MSHLVDRRFRLVPMDRQARCPIRVTMFGWHLMQFASVMFEFLVPILAWIRTPHLFEL